MPFYTIQRTPRAQEDSSNVVAIDGSEPVDSSAWNGEMEDDNELPAYDSLIPATSTLFQPQSIVIDHSLIFPAEPPANALYQLNHNLDSGNSVTIGRIDHTTTEAPGRSPRTRVRDRPIYTFSHEIFNHKRIIIDGKRRDGFSSSSMYKNDYVGGRGWSLVSNLGGLLTCTPTRKHLFSSPKVAFKWIDEGGKLVAVEDKQKDRPESKDAKNSGGAEPDARPVLTILEPLEQKAVDILVTAWCARVWHDTLEANKAQLTLREGGSSSRD
ncbi:hypothetical protein MMC10_009764 [Thelotrema lepadinum]|nr:hypothetical protein [Thelotrema lepadinum]